MDTPTHGHREFLTRTEAADFLRLSPQSLTKYALRQTGPAFSRTGPKRGRVIYRLRDLISWAEARKVGGR